MNDAVVSRDSSSKGPAKKYMLGFLSLVLLSTGLALPAIHSNFVMIDEYAHVPAGISYWQLGRFSIYRETPPLIQCLMAIPPLASGAKVDYTNSAGRRSEWAIGRDFLYLNAPNIYNIFRKARCVILIISVVCGIIIFRWTSEAAGELAAVACASLWLIDPSVLAFAGVCTSDVGAAALSVTSSFFFWRYVKNSSVLNMLIAGVGLGLALSAKFNTIGLYPAWMVAAFIHRFDRRMASTASTYTVGGLLAVGVIGVAVLNSIYLFEGSGTRLGSFEFQSRSLSGKAESSLAEPQSGNRFRETFLSDLPTPLPRNYLLGLDSQRWEAEVGLEDFRQGKLVSGGRWFSPFITLFYKLPIGTLLLVVLGLLWTFSNKERVLDAQHFLTMGGFMLLLIIAQTGLNWPVRYLLVVLPFVFISIGGFVKHLLKHNILRWIVFACIGFNLYEVASSCPHYISYCNELGGGSAGGQRIFHGSNYDWGQDLYRLKQWMDDRTDLAPVAVSYYGPVPPEFVGIPLERLPAMLAAGRVEKPATIGSPEALPAGQHFYWAISSNFLNGMIEEFRLDDGSVLRGRIGSPLLTKESAVARVGSSIYIFDITADVAKRSAKSLSLVELKGCIGPTRGETMYSVSP